jgi:hypothetical protein
MSHSFARQFSKPLKYDPDATNQTITPMDLASIKRTLTAGMYASIGPYINDVALTFANAMAMSEVTSDMYFHAVYMRQYFDSMLLTQLHICNEQPSDHKFKDMPAHFPRRVMNLLHNRLCSLPAASMFLDWHAYKAPYGIINVLKEVTLSSVAEDLKEAIGSREEYVRTVLVVLANVMILYGPDSKEYQV